MFCWDTSVNELALFSIGVFIWWTPEYCLLISPYYLYCLEDPLLRGEAKVLSYLCLAPGHCPSPWRQCHIHIHTAPHSLGKDQLVLYSVVIPMLNPIICTLKNKDIREALKVLGEKVAAFKFHFPWLAVFIFLWLLVIENYLTDTIWLFLANITNKTLRIKISMIKQMGGNVNNNLSKGYIFLYPS